MRTPRSLEDVAIFAAPSVFVVFWASGFIGAKLGLPYAEPLTFLALRMFGVVVLLGLFILIAGARWPSREGVLDSYVPGVLMHALYLGGVYISIAHSLPAALSALVEAAAAAHLDDRQSAARRARRAAAVGRPHARVRRRLVVQDRATVGAATPLAWIGAVVHPKYGRGNSVRAWGDGVRDPGGALDAGIFVRAWLARIRTCVTPLFRHPPRGGNAGGQPVLSDAASGGCDGLELFGERLAPSAIAGMGVWSAACSW